MTQTLYLIDGYAQIFRAFYAIRNGMRSPVTSEPTHAVFGMTGMLLKLLSQLKPDYVVVAWDAPGKTFRDEIYPEYKATRNATPEDLTAQIPRIRELIEHFNIPIIGQSGLEADDIIATITQKILADSQYQDVNIRIVSKDKDLEQLLCDRVSLYDIHTDTEMTVATLLETKGIKPAQVIDLLALTGDTVDNVPGVAGIGPKTATLLLQEFGTIDGILSGIEKIKGKRRECLEAARETLPLSRTLVTLKSDAELEFLLEEARVGPPHAPKLVALFQQLGFNRFQTEVIALAGNNPDAHLGGMFAESQASDEVVPIVEIINPSAPVADASMGEYSLITTLEQLDALVTTLKTQSMLSFDTETTGLERDSLLCGISLSWEPKTGVYIPTRSPDPNLHLSPDIVVQALKPILEDDKIAKCGHNLKFDVLVLGRSGIQVHGIAFDSMLAGALIDPSQSQKLDNLALSRLNYKTIALSEILGEGSEQIRVDQAPLDKIGPYAAEDADIALRLYLDMLPQLESLGMAGLLRDVEAPLVEVLAEMETNGILCDPDELRRQGALLAKRVDAIRQDVYTAAECTFDLNSTKQLAEVLFDKLGLVAGRKTKTGRSTAVEVLEKLALDEDKSVPKTSVPRLILEYRQLTKLISTYLGNLAASVDPNTGRIYTTFHQLVTATGRLASYNPNLQNIPIKSEDGKQIRKAFHAPEGECLVCADYSQVELRILAHLSGDPALLDAFENDLDIHTAVAAQVFGAPLDAVTREQRSQAKTINFGIIYGVTPFGLARRIEGLDVSAATQLIAEYKQKFPGIDVFLQECIQQAKEHGYVTTVLGRRRAIPEILSSQPNMRGLGERLAINSVVQGSAADLIKIAMVNVQRMIEREHLPMKLLLQIHDELVLETPSEHADAMGVKVCWEMERAMRLRIPLKAECGVGYDWMSAK